MAKTLTRGALLLSTVVLVACKGGDPKQAACEQIVGCNCSMPNYASVDECVSAVDAAIDAARMSAEIEGLVFEEGCYDDILARLESNVECRTASEVELSDLVGCPYCTAVHGDKAVGQTCTVYQYGSDCASGLVCLGVNGATGQCASLCDFLAAGEVCVEEQGGQEVVHACAEGLRCDPTSKTCAPLLANGGLCDGDDDCESGYCDSTGACTLARGQGQACDAGRCDEFLVCEADTCVTAPPAGQPCPAFVCAAGSRCDFETMTCGLEEPLVCAIEFEQSAGMP